MESESSHEPPVNWFDSEDAEKSAENSALGTEPKPRRVAVELLDRRTFQNYLRILGWINGVWEKAHQRTEFYDWHAAAFSRATGRKGGKKIPVRTLERVFPKFQIWCQEYYFTRINVGGRWCIRITRNAAIHPYMPGTAAADRLVLAIRAYVAKAGRAKIDAEWVRKFSEISRISLNHLERAWLRLKKIPGLKHKWRGVGRGRKFVVEAPDTWAEICAERQAAKTARKTENLSVSHPQTSHPVSISLGNDKIKNSGPVARSPEESARATPANALPRGETDRGGEADAEPGGDETPGLRPYFGRWFPGRAPLQICNRLVLPQNLSRKASWLAVARLKFAHVDCERVRFEFPHARNFALAALRFGYGEAAIVAAWAAGVARSHQDALEADRLPGGGYASTRPPSAAKVYAWYALRAADPRPPEKLWAEFFAAAPAPRVPSVYVKSEKKKDIPAAAPRISPAEAAARLEELRAVVQAPVRDVAAVDVAALTLGELRTACQQVGISIATFNGLPWARKKEIVDRARRLREK